MLYALERGKREKLEATMHHFEEHMHERELTLAEKERAILDLRSNNLTLDNFRCVWKKIMAVVCSADWL